MAQGDCKHKAGPEDHAGAIGTKRSCGASAAEDLEEQAELGVLPGTQWEAAGGSCFVKGSLP